MEGYERGRPDVGWWEDQVNAGVKFREHWASEEKWTMWQAFYRGDYNPGILPKNVIFMMLRMMTPRIYFRNPGISITPKKPGPEAAAVAKVMERVSNQMMTHMGVKNESKKQVQNAFFSGTGIGKFGFGAQHTPTPDDEGTFAPLTKGGDKVEFSQGIMDNMPWYRTVDTANFVVPWGCDRFENAFFTAEKISRYTDDIVNDSRLSHRKEVQDQAYKKKNYYHPFAESLTHNPRESIDLWEIRDKRTQKVFIIAPTITDKVLYYGDDELQVSNGLPYFPIVFNPDNACFWGVPDIKILEPFQREINEIKTQMMRHRRLSIVKFIATATAISEDEVAKLLDEDGPGLVRVLDVNGIQNIEVAPIPDSLLKAEDRIMTDIREIMGLSRNEAGSFGEGSADRTATEVQAIRDAASIREDERRDVIADAHVSMVRLLHEDNYKHWTDEQVVQVIGPDQLPVWVRFVGQELAGYKFFIKIDPDQSVAETRAVREERAIRMYQLLQNNPLVDANKLTKYVLDNMIGVQFDDMLQPQDGAPGSQQNPLEMGQFAQQFEGQPGYA